MAIEKTSFNGMGKTILKLFPERQIYFRSDGIVKFIVLSPRIQIVLTAIMILVVTWVSIISYKLITRDSLLEARENSIIELTTANAQINSEMETLQKDVIVRTEQLEERQRYLQGLMALDPESAFDLGSTQDINEGINNADLAEPEEESSFQASAESLSREFFDFESDSIIRNNPNIIPINNFNNSLKNRLEAVTSNQVHLASSLLILSENRFSVMNDKLEPIGLSSAELLQKWDSPQSVISTGGPYVPDLISTSLSEIMSESSDDQPEEFIVLASKLNESWINFHKTQDIFNSMPVSLPANEYYVSSKFGRRTDPVKKTPAVHPGVDMSGWPGEIIMSAAGGKILKAGSWGPYGNMVEIDHGNGFKSRYGHMRKLLVQKGQIVGRGQKIGEMGCSGRCTGTHLHFEVWFGDQLQDPLPYLKTNLAQAGLINKNAFLNN